MRIRNGRRNGLLLILLALLLYAGWLRWADQLQRILPFDLSTVVITVCELTGIIGALLVIVSSLPPPRPKFPPTGAIPIMGARRRKWQRRTRARFSSLPPFGLFCSVLLSILVFLFPLVGVNATPIGLRVRLVKDISEVHSPRDAPLVVVVCGSLAIPHYSAGSEYIPKLDLSHALEEMLRYRTDKIVFIQADEDVEYQSVVAAIDAAKSTGAKVVLVTSAEKRPAR